MTHLDEPRRRSAPPGLSSPGPGLCRVPLLGGEAEAGYRRRGRWAITWGGVRATSGRAERALSEYLDVLRRRRLWPLVVDAPDPSPYARRAFYTRRYGRQAVLDLIDYDLAAAEPELRRDVDAADRAGLVVRPGLPVHAGQLAGFAPAALRAGPDADVRVAVRPGGAVVGTAVWSSRPQGPCRDQADDADNACVRLRLAVTTRAAGPALELLITDAAEEYRGRGARALLLGWRPASRWWPTPGVAVTGAVATTLPLFSPRWETRWLAIPSGWRLPSAAWALC